MLDCCSLRYYGRRFLFCRGRLSNTCNQPTFSSSLSLPFFERVPFPIPIFNSSLARKEKVGRGTFRETLGDRERERERARRFRLPLITLISNPLAKVVVSFPLQRLRIARNRDNNSIGNRNYGAPFPDTGTSPSFPPAAP